MSNVNYTALNSIEAIRINTGMFIGSTETPDHLVEEVLDNMLDEVTNGYANIGTLDFIDYAVWITDNGRGIKTDDMQDPDTGEFRDGIEMLTTKLFSGSKFRINEEVDYNVQIGMHGVGLVVVNALSDWFVLSTRDRNDRSLVHTYKFNNAELTSKTTYKNTDYSYSTLIGFQPSKKYFGDLTIDQEKFTKRLVLSQCLLSNSTFYVNNQEIPNLDVKKYIKTVLNLSDDNILYHASYHKSENEMIDVYFTYVNNLDTISYGAVNLRECDGTYITNFQTALKNVLSDNINKKFKDVNKSELLSGLRSYIVLTVPKPQFDSQAKSRMTINITKNLITPLKKRLEQICSQRNILDVIETLLNRKFKKKITSGKTTKRVSPGSKLRDCEKIPGETLYIVEGDSADGSLKECRDVKTEATYPLKGKSINVEKSSLEKLSKNKEFNEIKEALGSKQNRRYKRVKILADADVDGYHIVVLVLLILSKIADDMIKEGRVSVIVPPLYAATKGKQFVSIHDNKDLQYYRDNKYNIIRFKGLGEMNPDQLEAVIRSNAEYVVTWPETEQLLNSLMTMVSSTDIRKRLMNSDCSFNMILETIKPKTKEESV